MRQSISYVSTAKSDLSKEHVENLLESTATRNNALDISGILLCSEGNFFQLLEGEKEKVNDLFSIIKKDSRHNNLIKFIDKPAAQATNEGYFCDFITQNTKFDQSNLENYLRYIQVLDRKAQNAVKRVLESMIAY
ncbi:MAG: BLUF domain-containing protein [Bacteroidota bacterium]